MDAVISLGGSVVADAVETNTLDEYVDVFNELSQELDTLVIVTGAGPLKRYIDAADRFGVSEARKDMIGIAATRLQASTLAAALHGNVYIPETLEEVEERRPTHDVIVLGGLLPGQSTDAVAAECAEIIEADRLVIATTVDGVYTGDPATDGDAEKINELSYHELRDIVLEQEQGAGEYALMDLTAASLIDRSEIETVVLDGTDPAVIGRALTDDHDGSTIR